MMTQARAAKTPETRTSRPARKAAAAPAAKRPAKAPAPTRQASRIEVHESGVHGKGVFAVAEIPPGEVVIEYQGELITWPEALRRHPHDPSQPNHTFYFHIDDGRVIDGNVHGNDARWINHACEPNCEADEDGSQVFIKSLRPIMPGEELFYDYGLIIDAKYTKKLKKEFECRCGFPSCRGTMLAPKPKSEKVDKDKKDDKKSGKKAKKLKKDDKKKSVKAEAADKAKEQKKSKKNR